MKKLLLPLILVIVGTAAGTGAGIFLKPKEAQVEMANPCGEVEPDIHADEEHVAPAVAQEFVKLNNQFVVPVVKGDRVTALVVMNLSIGVGEGEREKVFSYEPKLRDVFLRALFDYSTAGGFDGAFIDSIKLDNLRHILLEEARIVLGPIVAEVLITDLGRQDS